MAESTFGGTQITSAIDHNKVKTANNWPEFSCRLFKLTSPTFLSFTEVNRIYFGLEMAAKN